MSTVSFLITLSCSLRDFRAQISLASSQRDAAVSAAVKFLQDASGPRVGAKRELRGSVSEAIRRVEAVEGAYADVKADNDRSMSHDIYIAYVTWL